LALFISDNDRSNNIFLSSVGFISDVVWERWCLHSHQCKQYIVR